MCGWDQHKSDTILSLLCLMTRLLVRVHSPCPAPCIANHPTPPPPLSTSGLPQGPHILLSTYKLVQSLPTETLARYNVVICDESHKLKNPATEQ